MATFELYINGVQMNDVPKMDEFTETLDRDYSIRGLIFKYPNGILLFGDAYRYLYDLWIADGFCQTVDVTIQKIETGGKKTRIDGLIFLSDVEWRWDDGSVEVTIEDNSWSARIINNWSVAVNLRSTTTKNGESITPPSTVTINAYDPNAVVGTYLGSPQPVGIRLYNALEHMLEWVSDNVVSFESSYLLNIGYGTLVTTGNSTRTGVADQYEISLETLLDSVMKIHDLWFTIIDDKDGTYTFKLEPYDDLFDDSPTLSLSKIKGVVQSLDTGRLYSNVKVGGEAKKDLDGTLSLPYYRMTTHAVEDYYFFGECNVGSTLDVTYSVICDSNIIEDLVLNNNSDYDDQFFLIQYNTSTLNALKNKYADISAPIVAPFYYNEPFLNSEILNRYELPNTLRQTFGNDTDTCSIILGSDSASLSSTSTSVNPVLYATELSDAGGRYNPANGRYTAGGNGTFTFEGTWLVALTVNNNNADSLSVQATLIVRDSGGTQRETHSTAVVAFNGASTGGTGKEDEVFAFDWEFIQYLDQNTTVEIKIDMTLNTGHAASTRYQYYSNSSFRCTATYDGGGTFIEQSPIDYRAVVIGLEDGISDDDWNLVKENPSAMFLIDRDGKKNMRSWIKSVDRNLLTGAVNAEFICNLAQANRIGI